MEIRPDYLKVVKAILRKRIPECEVRVFGSRATGRNLKEHSDLDLAVVGKEKLEPRVLGDLKDDLEESDLPFRVDVLDWNAISPEFRKVIEQGYEVVQEPVLILRDKEPDKLADC